jgi:hypothetical protein
MKTIPQLTEQNTIFKYTKKIVIKINLRII